MSFSIYQIRWSKSESDYLASTHAFVVSTSPDAALKCFRREYPTARVWNLNHHDSRVMIDPKVTDAESLRNSAMATIDGFRDLLVPKPFPAAAGKTKRFVEPAPVGEPSGDEAVKPAPPEDVPTAKDSTFETPAQRRGALRRGIDSISKEIKDIFEILVK